MRKILLLLVLALLGITSLMLLNTQEKTDQQKTLDQAQGQATERVGGDFTLTDHTGHSVSADELRGRVLLVYFGFTHCPDICPVTVAALSKTMELLGDKADEVTPLFITVDPKRDTPDVLKDYLAPFDSRIVGLTGTQEQIAAVAAEYKAYFAHNNVPWSEESPSDDHEHMDHSHMDSMDMSEHHEHGGEYNVDHSGYIYLMGKDGQYIRLFSYDTPAEDIARAVEPYLQ